MAVEFRAFVEPQQGAGYADQLAVAQTAEYLGFAAFFRSDHDLAMSGDGQPGPTDSWVTLGAIARETSSIRLGTLVTSATFATRAPWPCTRVIKGSMGGIEAVIYTRKSTLSDGKSTRDQEEECRQWCTANSIEVEKVFCDEGKSASRYGTKPRDAWEAVKAYLRPGHILVTWESSRTARDLGEHVALRDLVSGHKIPIAYSGRVLDVNSGDDRFNAGLDALLAERESEQIRERVLRGLRGAAAGGTPHGMAPWGYVAVPRKPGSRPQWELDPVEAPRVREAVERILEGESRRSVLEWLQSTGYAPASPGALTRSLLRPTLAGKRVHRGKVVGNGTWEAIITADQHRRLVAVSKALTTGPGPEAKHLGTGLVRCAKCGRGVRYRTVAKRRRYPLYACPRGCASMVAELVDAELWRAVHRSLRNVNPSDYDSEDPEVAAAVQQIEQLEADLAKWKAKAIAGDVDADVYAAVEKDRKAKMNALRPRTATRGPLRLRPENWDSATLQERRNAVRALLDARLTGRGQIDITRI